MVRTKKPHKSGCLSRTLTDFIQMTPEQQKKKYGNNVHKYWDRVVEEIKASFDDHTLAYHWLPNNYAKKIDFIMFYKSMMSQVQNKNWINGVPDDTIEHLIDNLSLAYQDITNTPIGPIAENDFHNVEKWLSYLKQLKKLKKEQPKIYDSYFPSF